MTENDEEDNLCQIQINGWIDVDDLYREMTDKQIIDTYIHTYIDVQLDTAWECLLLNLVY